MEHSEQYYLLSHLVLGTGLTDRTLRSYISSGILVGEKINGLWHFTPEAVDAFLRHPAVRPSILAKQNGSVYDFLLDTKKKTDQICIILDLPGGNKKEIAEYFCYRISNEDYCNLHFSFDGIGCVPRVILKGSAKDVLRLVNEFQR